MKLLVTIALMLAACEPHDVLGTGWDLPGLDVVYQCEVGSSSGPDTLELCSDLGEAGLERVLLEGFATASCRPTPRHLGPCVCGGPCNAYQGCLCSSDLE